MKKRFLGKRIIATTIAMTMMFGSVGCSEKTKDKKSSDAKVDVTYTESVDDGYVVGDYESQSEGSSYETGETMAYEESVDNSTIIISDGDCREPIEEPDFNTNEYDDLAENSWMSVSNSPLSTFAADVDTASYTELRSNLLAGYDVPASSIRIEEMINYFDYDYETPSEGEKFSVYTEYADCPWNEDTKLALVSLNTEEIDFSEAPESNIVFLIDTSGSMFDDDKLPLVQQSMCMLAENLTEKDKVSIVTYAGSETVVLEGVSGDNYYEICSAIEQLEANGSTNGSAGIETAYEIAEKYYIKGGNNRVILATDGDLNVGVTSEGELEKLITEKKKSGVFLSVIGVGNGNYKDNKLETLADKGNGNYAYIDSIFEAKKALVDDLGATMVTVAKDVKLQVEFNPAQVKGYRLIGYENRVMAAEDFADDKKDGGEMGAGHSVTAIYEIALVDSDMEINTTDLKYDNASDSDAGNVSNDYGNELFTVNVRYKEPEADKSELESYVCTEDNYIKSGSDNLRWAAAVASFGMYLKDSEYLGSTDKELILELAKSTKDAENDDYKKEFIDLVDTYYDLID